MATTTAACTIHFPEYYDAVTELEVCDKGWFAGVTVELPDGSVHPVFFYDPVRLGQDLAADAKQSRPFIAEPGLIVVPEVTRAAMTSAIEQLVKQGYFEHVRALAGTISAVEANGAGAK
jgi:hypothetical protein